MTGVTRTIIAGPELLPRPPNFYELMRGVDGSEPLSIM